jgi:serine phosphatase RsbU (regulator of sigma subunit)/CRP-like cAMP-binding protein
LSNVPEDTEEAREIKAGNRLTFASKPVKFGAMSLLNDPAIRQRLRFNVLLETLTEEEFNTLTGKLEERDYEPGDIIIEDETHGEEMFFLIQGRVRIAKTNLKREEQVLAILHPGDCFGELELIAGRPRSARVAAVDRVSTFAMGREAFGELVTTSRAFAVRLLQVLSIRVRALNYHFIHETNRKLDQSRREVQKLEQLIEATKKVNSTLDLDQLLEIILAMALRIVDGDRGTVYLIDEERNQLWTKVSGELDGAGRVTIHLPIGMGIAGYVGATGDVINIPDAYLDPRFNPDFDKRTGYRTQSILCMPMRNKDGKIIGVFQLLNKRTGLFTEEDATFLDALSVHAALAIENARLYEQEREKIRIERDLLAASEVQRNLLPKHPPEVAGYDFAATTIPAREVAGDLYDFVHLDADRLAWCLGDVSGKGLPAALLMANIQAVIRDQARTTNSARECVIKTNRQMAESTTPEKFVTLMYGVLDTNAHTLQYCNAGQDYPFLCSADGSSRRLSTGGVVVGIMEEFPYEEETLTIHKGDVLAVYSDGIAEAVGAAQEQFGDDRIGGIVRDHRHESAAGVRDAIVAAVRAHVGDAPALDDMTLVIIKRV